MHGKPWLSANSIPLLTRDLWVEALGGRGCAHSIFIISRVEVFVAPFSVIARGWKARILIRCLIAGDSAFIIGVESLFNMVFFRFMCGFTWRVIFSILHPMSERQRCA